MPRGEIINDAIEAQALVVALVGRGEAAISREAALLSTARAVGVSKWSLWSLYHGRRKTVGYSTLAALRREYLRLCERQVRQLEAEMAALKRRCGDAVIANLDREVARVAKKVRLAREIYG